MLMYRVWADPNHLNSFSHRHCAPMKALPDELTQKERGVVGGEGGASNLTSVLLHCLTGVLRATLALMLCRDRSGSWEELQEPVWFSSLLIMATIKSELQLFALWQFLVWDYCSIFLGFPSFPFHCVSHNACWRIFGCRVRVCGEAGE